MKKSLLISTICLIFSTASAQNLQFGPPADAPRGQSLDEIGLIVNNTAVSRRTLAADLAAAKAGMGDVQGISPALVEERAMDHIIMKYLLADVMQRADIAVSDAEIDSAVVRIAAQNGIAPKELFARVRKDTGLNEAAYRAQLREDLAYEKLRGAMIGDAVKVSEQAIDDQITQIARRQGSTIHVQDLLVKVPEGEPNERGGKVREILALVSQAIAGSADLREAASKVPGAAFNDLGVINIGQIPPNFARAVVTLAPGQVVPQPVIDSDGMHFLKVISKTGDERGAAIIPEAKVRHILLRSTSRLDEKTQEENIARIHAQLQGGADFEELARRFSHDQNSAVKGGDLGWVSADQLVPEFVEMMLKTPPGQISAPFQSSFGWHVLKVEDIRQVDRSEEKLRERIRESLYNKALEEAWQQKLIELRENAYIQIK